MKKNTEAAAKNGPVAENTDMKQWIFDDNLRFVTGGQKEQDEDIKYNQTDHTNPNKKRGPQL